MLHHIVSGRYPITAIDEIRPTRCNTEADRGRAILQQKGHASHRVHVYTEATTTNGNVREWVAGLGELLPDWEEAVVVTDSYHILRTLFGARLALLQQFGDRPVSALVTLRSRYDRMTAPLS